MGFYELLRKGALLRLDARSYILLDCKIGSGRVGAKAKGSQQPYRIRALNLSVELHRSSPCLPAPGATIRMVCAAPQAAKASPRPQSAVSLIGNRRG